MVHGIADLLLLSVGNVAIDLKGVVMGHLNMGTQQQTYRLHSSGFAAVSMLGQTDRRT